MITPKRQKATSMRYGYFDDKAREYVIDRPDTPAPWVNYLGSPAYGAIISNNAGGYSFERSGANGRILRYVFNQFDQPGRYIYLRDDESGDFWSASWQPVAKDLNDYQVKCCHGMGYTRMEASYAGISSKAVYYVPQGKAYEVWALTVTNDSDRDRSLTLTGYAEFTNHSNYEQDQVNLQYTLFIGRTVFEGNRISQQIHSNYEQDQVNLQYSLFIGRTVFEGNRITQQIHGNLDALAQGEDVDDKTVTERFFGLAGAPVSSYCGDKTAFLGAYHGYGNPQGVAAGDLGNLESYNENSCGALSCKVKLAPGESKTILFATGMKPSAQAAAILAGYTDPAAQVQQEVDALKAEWYSRFSHLQVETPDPAFNTMLNTWNAYNCFITFIWSRAASLIYCGLRNGYGYRDTVQDIQGIIHLEPEMACEKIRFMLSAQVDNGGGLPLVKFTHNPGLDETPDDLSYEKETGLPAFRAEYALWLFPTVYKYVAESGNLAFLDEVIPFANRDQGTVYEHLKRAVEFSLNHLGPHGLPAGLYADWNDCLRLGANGESAFVAFQFYYAMRILRQFAAHRGADQDVRWLDEKLTEYQSRSQELCWDGDRFIRGFTEAGERIGEAAAPEANFWLNPQSWAVISGLADSHQADTIMEGVSQRLNTAYGAVLMDPPYHAHAFDGALAVIYNPGTKENAGIFSQSQGWLILAEALCGHGERAFGYFTENAPAAQNDRAEIRHLEPYCYGQFTEGPASKHFGRSQVHWLTGTASTVMVGCVEGILGLRPDLDGLRLAPAIPKECDSFTMESDFRGHRLHICVENPGHHESGCRSLTLNGQAMPDNYIPASALRDENDIILTM